MRLGFQSAISFRISEAEIPIGWIDVRDQVKIKSHNKAKTMSPKTERITLEKYGRSESINGTKARRKAQSAHKQTNERCSQLITLKKG